MISQNAISSIQEVSDLIEKRTGIVIHAAMQDTLSDLLLQTNNPDYVETLIRSRETDAVWQSLLSALTIGETYFLRDHAHFELLRDDILPSLIQQRQHSGQKQLNIWSVGCASGEEPYSLAIILSELIPDLQDWDITIMGSDINNEALRSARRGIYRKWAFRHTDGDFQQKYFDQTDTGLSIKPAIRDMVTFRNANLFNDLLLTKFDLILCRNTLIYFSTGHTRRAEQLLFEALNPGGWLLLGHSEVVHHNCNRWITHQFPGRPIYQRPLPKADSQRVLRETQQFKKLPRPVAYHDIVLVLQQEDYTRAEALTHEFLKMEPDYAPAHLLLAYTQANHANQEEAHHQIATALRLDPLLADAHYLKAALLFEEDDTQVEKCRRALEAALYCQRNHPLASFMLGSLHAKEGNLPRAISHWRNALKATASLMPDSPVSDISQTTAGQLQALIQEQIEGWEV